ncbi:MAG: hypothetical protein WD689_08795 [Gaiellaceae bacterium]
MEQQPSTPPPRPTIGMPATLPIPGNAEFALYLLVEIGLVIIWAASDLFDVSGFVTATVVLTSTYFISRGIAKASRVYEQ